MATEVIPERVEPIITILPSPLRLPIASLQHSAPGSKPREKKKKKEHREHKSSKQAFDQSSSHRSPKRLRKAKTDKETSSTLDFLSKRVMILNHVMVELSDSKRRHYTFCLAKS